MSDKPPERVTVSIPSNSPVDKDRLDELVDQSECENRSEFIRELLKDETDTDDDV